MDDWKEEVNNFNRDKSELQKLAEEFISNYWGDRCLDYAENCPCCKRWKAMDDFTDSGEYRV